MKKQHDIEDPLERAATKGIIGGGKPTRPVAAISSPQAEQPEKEEQGSKKKRERKGQFVYLPPELIRYLKHQAVDRDLEISEIVEEAVREYRERHQS
jgi:hypothetical protein